MSKTQKGSSAKISKEISEGFALIEGLLLVLILAVIGFGGYYVWNSQKNADKSLTQANQVSQSTGKTASAVGQKITLASGSVSVVLPEGWSSGESGQNPAGATCAYRVLQNDNMHCLEGKYTFPPNLSGSEGGWSVTVSVFDTSTGNKDPKNWFEQDFGDGSPVSDSNNTVSSSKINSYSAFTWEQNQDPIIDEHYVLAANNKIVYVYARTKDSSYDLTKYSSDIKSMVNSIKIN